MSKLNIDEIKDAERKVLESELTIWNSRLAAAANNPEALDLLLELGPFKEKEKPAPPEKPTNVGCPCTIKNGVAGCGV
jgi:hypothetical protein